MNSFSNVAPVTQPEGSGASSTFKPQQANQFEAGAKMDLFQGKLSFTASLYHIEVNNITGERILASMVKIIRLHYRAVHRKAKE